MFQIICWADMVSRNVDQHFRAEMSKSAYDEKKIMGLKKIGLKKR